MKDFPVFTTEFGVASLILKEIPYRQEAFVHIRDAQQPEELLRECISFCRICGAEAVYLTGHPVLEQYPLHTAVWRMRGELPLEEEPACLFPVTEETVSEWRRIYNEKMRGVPNAATLEQKDETKIVESHGAYFVHDSGELLGIGWMDGDHLEAMASVRRGAGEKILKALQSLIPGRMMELEVASANERAVRLYERLGFLKTSEISRWYILP